MPQFADELQQKTLAKFRQQESEDLARLRAQKLGLPYADLEGVPFEIEALSLIEKEEAKVANLVAFQKDGKKIRIASVDPQTEEASKIIDDLRAQGLDVDIYVVTPHSLDKAWVRYQDVEAVERLNVGTLGIQDELLTSLVNKTHSKEEIEKILNEHLQPTAKTTDLVETIVASAVSLDASDIHLEPQEEDVQLRFRLDGVLIPLLRYQPDMHQRLVSRIKLMSGLKLNVHTEAQDGRFSIKIGGLEIEVRTSILPGSNGESVVMRLLNPDETKVSIEKLGIHPSLLEVIKRELQRPNGLILTTGPTGSGKSTAMYSFLKHIYQPGIKIITIENPVEYHLDGIVQTQVDKEKGYDFYDGLRSALRQDPDVIMVGEIRDENTAVTAVQAALTGHLVFSTLHTNDAAGAFPRFLDLGANRDTLGPALNLVLAQRLIRTVREDASEEIDIDEQTYIRFKNIFEGLNPEYWQNLLNRRKMRVIKNDVEDENNAYRGRSGVFEGIVVDIKVEEVLRTEGGTPEIRSIQKEQGLPNMAQHALIKILEGLTTLDEVERVVDLD